MQTTFSLDGPTQLLKYTLLLPQDLPHRQKILRLQFEPKPSRIYEKYGNRYAEFRFHRPQEDLVVRWQVDALIWPYHLQRARNLPLHVPSEDLRDYLKADRYQEVNAPEIQRLAQGLSEKDPLKSLQIIYQLVLDTLSYEGEMQQELGASGALAEGRGDCTEYADLLIALCRAAGIPARTVSGLALKKNMANPNHHWAEVWLPTYGWIPVDPTTDVFRNRPIGPDLLAPSQHYLYLARTRWDKICKSSNNRWVASGKVHASYQYEWKQRLE
jgi:transglutaminase-like putative cysteine protease